MRLLWHLIVSGPFIIPSYEFLHLFLCYNSLSLLLWKRFFYTALFGHLQEHWHQNYCFSFFCLKWCHSFLLASFFLTKWFWHLEDMPETRHHQLWSACMWKLCEIWCCLCSSSEHFTTYFLLYSEVRCMHACISCMPQWAILVLLLAFLHPVCNVTVLSI